jgi:ABC-type transport system involved in multi-copper enzyme maturation permease subunit
MRALQTLARDALREAVRGRWLWMTLLGAIAVAAIAFFARALALIEERDVALAFAAPLARLVAVVIVAMSAISSTAREKSERTLLLALAAPVSRTVWVLGKAAGLALIALGTALILGIAVAILGPDPLGFAAWLVSLVLELMLSASVAMAISLVLAQIPPATFAFLAFYLLARDLHVLQLLGQRAENFSELENAGRVVQAISYLFPRLDLFTRSEWLLQGAPGLAVLGAVALQALVYCTLALCVAVIDLRRSELG